MFFFSRGDSASNEDDDPYGRVTSILRAPHFAVVAGRFGRSKDVPPRTALTLKFSHSHSPLSPFLSVFSRTSPLLSSPALSAHYRDSPEVGGIIPVLHSPSFMSWEGSLASLPSLLITALASQLTRSGLLAAPCLSFGRLHLPSSPL